MALIVARMIQDLFILNAGTLIRCVLVARLGKEPKMCHDLHKQQCAVPELN
jgi:hypothetical protein